MVRLKTLRKMAQTGNRTLFRIRRRAMPTKDHETGEWVVDSDGEEGKPDTWSRWEAEYCSTHVAALRVASDRKGPRERQGVAVIDRSVCARDLARDYEDENDLEEGLWRVIYPCNESNGRAR